MGIALGLGSSLMFSLGAVCIKLGMRHRPDNNGFFMSVLVNCLVIGVVMLFVNLPPWDWIGFVVFIVAGIMTTFLGRGATHVAIHLIGPARQSAIFVCAPLFTAIAGWIALGETVTAVQAMGAVLMAIGLIVLVRFDIGSSRPLAQEVGATLAPVRSLPKGRSPFLQSPLLSRGVAAALLSAALFGLGFTVRKIGLSYYPSAVAGAFIGALTSLTLIISGTSVRGRLGDLARDNFNSIPWLFVLGGTATGVGMLLQFVAFGYLPAWIVSQLQGTQPLWTLTLSFLILKKEENIGMALLLSVTLVMVGVTIISMET